VAHTGPIIALWLGNQLPLLPKVLKSLHVPRDEVQEWKRTIAKLQQLRVNTPLLDTEKLIEQWSRDGFLHHHDLSITQINRAERLNPMPLTSTSSMAMPSVSLKLSSMKAVFKLSWPTRRTYAKSP